MEKDACPREADISSVPCWWGTGQETDNYQKKLHYYLNQGEKNVWELLRGQWFGGKFPKPRKHRCEEAGKALPQPSQTKGALQQLLLQAKTCSCAGDVVVVNRLLAAGIPSSCCSLLPSFWDSGAAQTRAADSPVSGKPKRVAPAPV